MYFVHHVARLLVTRTILYAYACYQAEPLQHFITVSLALVLQVRTSYGYVPPTWISRLEVLAVTSLTWPHDPPKIKM